MASSVILVETPEISADTLEKVLLQGDLERLGTAERLNYYSAVCHSLGLNPLTRPFEYIRLNGKLTLYAKRECTEQLRKIHGVDIEIKSREVTEGCYVVTAGAKLPSGRRDESLGAVPIDTLKGEARANAMMKAETKAKRRVTMAICGLSFLDETEVDSVASAHRVPIDPIDGDIIPGSKEAAKAVAQEKIAEIVANKDRIAREAAAQAIYEPVNDISAATVMEERPVFSDEPGLQPPHDKELRDSIKKYGVRDTKKTPKKIEMLQAFGGLKKKFAAIKRTDAYYATLGAYGAVHSSDFSDTPAGIKQARECYNEMRITCADLEAEADKAAQGSR